ncbi:uncharacterized protein L969DRAFT_26521 [Mixia osmundae IAM 14324]|uniref:Major facilitator superfamily (MFS) profile domain-containing protein n=1 Tax=Mixia osmundae (strain CBS 9802 / IAM 14324 / JCM 22182 / KY 12970) TaxID=764103 RepID=G7DW53_MIXOS|nr:uncharacterized protein L969DRAFT_26521 [Mixia osmundae IAM 14324]KEI36444.1 hypothetical protein L969DRAFT_26521 [Mixia osmundae IAM 14324]GAA94859.1 hypothetical protein E5Q_01513 [Mixia osmundae IAM 14324]
MSASSADAHDEKTSSHTASLNEHDTGVPDFEPVPSEKLAEEGKAGAAPERDEAAIFAAGYDKGWRGWATVGGAWVVLFCTFGYVNAFGVYQQFYSAGYLHESNSSISWVGTVQLFFMFSCGMVVGKLFDEGYFRALTICGSVLYTFSIFMLSLSKSYVEVFLAQGVAAGLGLGLLFLPSVSVIAHWFRKRRALAIGVVVSGSSIGGVCWPIFLNKRLERTDFGSAVRENAYLILGLLVIANLLMKPRLPGKKHRPAGLQLPPPDFKAILTHPAWQVAVAGTFFVMWGIFFPFFFVEIFSLDKGIDQNLSFYTLAILNSASTFGRVLPNFTADKIGAYNMMIPSVGITGIMIFVLLACGSPGGIVAFCILFGLFSGAFVSLMPSIFVALSRHPGEIGVRMGLAWAIVSIAALTGVPITGALLGSTEYTFWKPVVFSGTTVCFGTCLMAVSRQLRYRELAAQGKVDWRL